MRGQTFSKTLHWALLRFVFNLGPGKSVTSYEIEHSFNKCLDLFFKLKTGKFCFFQIGQYIGEMCRYMLATTPKPEDTQHCLRKMIGNGLRPAIWSAFVRRFKIPSITEVYGATEGNVNIGKRTTFVYSS